MQRKSIAPPPQLFLDGSDLYASQGSVYALNGKDGSVRQIYPISGQLAVANDVLYLNVSHHPDYLVQALRSSDGSVLWSYKAEGRLVQSPVISNERVYVCTTEGGIYALHASDGTLLWHFTITLGPHVPSYLGPIVFTAPTIINDMLYLAPNVNFPLKPFIYAFQAKDGVLLWQNPIPAASSVSFAASDGILCLSIFNGCLALDMNDGSVVWQKEFDPAFQVISQPVVLNGIVYLCFSEYKDDLSSDERIPGQQPFICALEAKNGSLLWQQSFGGMLQASSPAKLSVMDNVLLISSYDGVLYTYQRDNGKIRWSYKISENFLSSPIATKDVVYVSDSEGYIYALSLTDGTLLWQSSVSPTKISTASISLSQSSVLPPSGWIQIR